MLAYPDLVLALRPINAVAITPSDSTVFNPPLAAISVGTAGTVIVDCTGTGTSISFTCVAGQTLVGSFTKVHAASSAGALVGQW